MLNITKFAVCGLLLISATGCLNEHVESGYDFPEVSGQEVARFNEVQTANGARNDGTLYPAHFSGGELNSLGIAKLDRMLQADESLSPMRVYVAAADKEEMTTGRKTSVTTYLKDAGLRDEQIAVEVGSNPNAWSSSSEKLRSMERTNSSSQSQDVAAPVMIPVKK